MVMETQIIARECIKPSSPTPLHLKYYKLCLLDQYPNHYYAPRYLFYPFNLSGTADIGAIVSKRLQLLKQSLSETLVRYYPLAGKMTDNYSVDCNDEGVYFVEARALISLNEFLSKPDLSLIFNKFFPADGNDQSGQIAAAHAAKVQVTSFACGGLVVCAGISHMIGDGTTFSSFMKSWAATARKTLEEAVCRPSFDASSLFPPRDAYPREATAKAQFARFKKTGRFVTRRFVFEAKAIVDLKAKATSSSVQHPTRVEVVSAILSKCIMTAVKTKTGSHKPTLLTHAVNLRRKARPPLSAHLVGNIICHANTLCTDDEADLDGLVSLLREAITKPDADFVRSLQGAGGFRNYFQALKDEDEEYADVKDRITFTSSSSFGFYEIDFGWGKPIWVGLAGFGGSIISFATTVVLMNTRLGDGIEAYVFLLEDYMNFLQVDKELLAFATLDPSPLG
ncbi:HXXXD-type acyl-transferase family protein [Citrus sinensis]|uniref:Uncharacterized protein n=2 Tax=Citrus TaxID=2706 RepID=V4SXB7_CITCL|nr:vinorine synthase [Citrus x clementina]XP_006464878.3 stemmadenine O-acetyltransferase-like [Citrus sinensis]ESR45467.1 hypothetical protein CICLE_v10001125mg [Citrus x clementina]KAH9669016.1 HXXXD-type acyl-transferase family protein [Citrus sinensis]